MHRFLFTTLSIIIFLLSCQGQKEVEITPTQTTPTEPPIIITKQETKDISHMLKGGRYWEPGEGTISFKLVINELLRENLRLRYSIIQDQSKSGAFLTVIINESVLVKSKVIGEVHPGELILIEDELDISSSVDVPGEYTLTFHLNAIDTTTNGWYLGKIELFGIEGRLEMLQVTEND